VLLAGPAAPANAARQTCDFDPTTPDPLCLAITDVSPEPGATNVSLSNPPLAQIFFNQEISLNNIFKTVRLINVDTREDVTGFIGYSFGSNRLTIQPDTINFECDTTYEVIIRRLRSVSGLRISEVPGDVTFKKGTASWTFTTEPCPPA
jgi:Bacterial Ig-like domain